MRMAMVLCALTRTHCNTLQHTATYCNTQRQCVPVAFIFSYYTGTGRLKAAFEVVQCVVAWCSMSQCAPVYCSVMQCVAACYIVLQCVAVVCAILCTDHGTRSSSHGTAVVVHCGMMQNVAVCCSMLKCDVVCCSAPQFVAACCSCVCNLTHHYDTQCGSRSGAVTVCCSVMQQCVAVCCSVLQCVAVRCSAIQCVVVYCSCVCDRTHGLGDSKWVWRWCRCVVLHCAVYYIVTQCVVARYGASQCVAVRCSGVCDLTHGLGDSKRLSRWCENWQDFSKVNFTFIVQSKFSSELTFENFYLWCLAKSPLHIHPLVARFLRCAGREILKSQLTTEFTTWKTSRADCWEIRVTSIYSSHVINCVCRNVCACVC